MLEGLLVETRHALHGRLRRPVYALAVILTLGSRHSTPSPSPRATTHLPASAVIVRSYRLTGERDPETIEGGDVSASMWPVLGTPPIDGRTFGAGEDVRDGSAAVVGERLQRAGFSPSTRRRGVQVAARMRPGVTVRQVKDDVARIASQLETVLAATRRGWGANATGLREDVAGSARGLALTLVAAVGFLLLLACANVANLAMARVARRSDAPREHPTSTPERGPRRLAVA